MKFRNLIFSAMVVFAGSFGGVSIAEARDAVVTGTVNMRAGAGTQYRIIDRLHRGDRVRIEGCNRSGRWCLVDQRRGPDGWVSSGYLRPRGGGWRPGGGGHHGGGGGHHGGGGGGHHGGGGGHGGGGDFCFYGPSGYICFGN